jgi:hypothetical protein
MTTSEMYSLCHAIRLPELDSIDLNPLVVLIMSSPGHFLLRSRPRHFPGRVAPGNHTPRPLSEVQSGFSRESVALCGHTMWMRMIAKLSEYPLDSDWLRHIPQRAPYEG